MRILRNHENILTVYDIIPPKEPQTFAALLFIVEFVGANLDKIFETNQFLSTQHIQHILYQILSGLEYMHSMNIAHRDLKPANILINEDCSNKISSFDKS